MEGTVTISIDEFERLRRLDLDHQSVKQEGDKELQESIKLVEYYKAEVVNSQFASALLISVLISKGLDVRNIVEDFNKIENNTYSMELLSDGESFIPKITKKNDTAL